MAAGGLLGGLAALAGPITARVLMSLGMSVVTVAGAAVAVSALKSSVLTAMGAVPASGLMLAGLLGCWEGLGMIFGAITFAVTLYTLTKATSIIASPGG
jgi:hypothetical protein